MAASLPGTFNVQEFADSGTPLALGRLYTYSPGTTTQKVAYADSAGTIPHTYTSDGSGGQYIALDARGELPAPLYLTTGGYDLCLKRSDGSTVWTRGVKGVATDADIAAFAASSGSSLVGFLQGGPGAVLRTAQAKMRERVSVTDFGAVGDGVTDDTAAFQACADYCVTANKAMYVPGSASAYCMTEVAVTGELVVVGEHRLKSEILVKGTGKGFSVNTNDPAHFSALRITNNGSAAVGIYVEGPTGKGNAFSTFRDLQIDGFPILLQLEAAYGAVVDSCHLSTYTDSGILVRNVLDADWGDSVISNNLIANGSGGSAVGIKHESSGGLRILGNKLNVGTYGYRLSPSAGAATSVLVIDGNSFENFTTAPIQLTNAELTASYDLIVISNNEIALSGNGILVNPSVAVYFNNVSITGNVIALPSTGLQGISLSYVTNVIVDGNAVVGTSTVGQEGVAYDVPVSGKHGINAITGFPAGKQVVNASGNIYVAKQRNQTGTSAVTCSTAYGSLYQGQVSVTFGASYDLAPEVRCDNGSVVGYVSSWPSSITKTGFTLNVLSTTNGGAGDALWSADGQ